MRSEHTVFRFPTVVALVAMSMVGALSLDLRADISNDQAANDRSVGSRAETARPPADVSARPSDIAGTVVPTSTANDAHGERSTAVTEPVAPPEPEQWSLSRGEDGIATIVMYGDSLASEAQQPFLDAFSDRRDVQAEAYTYGGTATCDWLDDIASRLRTGPVDAVVLEFSGNALTPCMQDPATGQALGGTRYLDAYEAYTRRAVELARAGGAVVYLALAPVARDELAGGRAGALREVYRHLAAAESDVRVLDAGDAVLGNGAFAAALPCLDFEDAQHGCERGMIEVRKPSDGVHFCPSDAIAIGGVVGRCAVWSSGAYRYGTAMADGVLADLEVGTA